MACGTEFMAEVVSAVLSDVWGTPPYKEDGEVAQCLTALVGLSGGPEFKSQHQHQATPSRLELQ